MLHDLLRFILVWSVYLCCGIALFATLMLVSSLGDPRPKNQAPSLTALILGRLFPSFFPQSAGAAPSKGRRRNRRANQFKTMRAAKEYLATRIVEEAKNTGTPLSDIERKMLYFTESGWTLPDIYEANAEFDRDYDEIEYEKKIGELVGNIQARDAAQSQQEQAAWDDAVEKLSQGDHYLLILIDAAPSSVVGASSRRTGLKLFLPTSSRTEPMGSADLVRLILMAFLVPFGIFLLLFLRDRLFGPDWHDKLDRFLR